MSYANDTNTHLPGIGVPNTLVTFQMILLTTRLGPFLIRSSAFNTTFYHTSHIDLQSLLWTFMQESGGRSDAGSFNFNGSNNWADMKLASEPLSARAFNSTNPSAKHAPKTEKWGNKGTWATRLIVSFISPPFFFSSSWALLDFQYISSNLAQVGSSVIAQLLTKRIFWFALHTRYQLIGCSTWSCFIFVSVGVLSTP